MQILSSNVIGPGFAQLPPGAPIQTSDQYYHAGTQSWVISSFFTSQGERTNDRVVYRRPVSIRAKLSVLSAVIDKVWRKRIKPLFARP